MSDDFDPPPGDPAALAAAGTRFGTISAQMTTDAGTVKSAVATAIANWTGVRASDFQNACFGLQVELESVLSTSGTVSQLLAAYSKQFTDTTATVAGLKRQYDAAGTAADAQAAKLPPQSDQIDVIYQHAGMRQGSLAQQARTAKSELATLATKLAAAIDAETNLIVAGGSTLTPDELRRRVDSAYGVTGLQGAAAGGTLTATQAWSMMAPAMAQAKTILDVVENNKDGELPGGPVTSMTTDPAILAALLDDARTDGIAPTRYAGLLAQYWAVQAAMKAGIDLNGWDPAAGTSGNRSTISAVYGFYGSLFLNNPNLTWAGMANMIGPSFAAGFLDINMFKNIAGSLGGALDDLPGWAKDALPPELRALGAVSNMSAAEFGWFEQKFLAMQKHIFFDQGAMHEAYVTPGANGGINAINEMYQAGLIDAKALQAWTDIDSGDPTRVTAGNTALLWREQNQIIANQYDQMRNHDGPVGEAMTYLMTVVGSASIPGTKTPAQYSPLKISAEIETGFIIHEHVGGSVSFPLPDFNIADKDSRWDYVLNDTLPAYQKLLATDPAKARQIVASSVNDRIDQQRILNRAPDLIENFLTDWSISVNGGISIGFP